MADEQNQKHFLMRLQRLVTDDLLAQKMRLQTIWATPLEERIRSGKAVANIRYMETSEDGSLHLHWPQNDAIFREGDILCLHRGDPFSWLSCTVNLEYDEEDEVAVSPVQGCGIAKELAEQPDGWLLDFGFFDLSQRYLTAFDEAARKLNGRDSVLPVLMNHRTPQPDPRRHAYALKIAQESGLNWSQCEALASSYATDSFYLVQGPPGTGKTEVLARLAKLLAQNGERVLVTALTHRAINNALQKVRKVGPDLPVCKIGMKSQARDMSGVDNFESFRDTPFTGMHSQGYIVGATPFAARSSRLSGVDFNVVLFDESSQVTLPLALMGMLSGERFIFIGDDKQLPPVFSALPFEEELGKSVFELLLPHEAVTMLDETYRLNDRLTDWPSHQFYDGELTSQEGAAGKRLQLPRPPRQYTEILNPQKPLVFVRSLAADNTTDNGTDADITVSLIEELLRCGVPADEIAVVTPFRRQSRKIRNKLRQSSVAKNVAAAIVADTVERMQGQERDVILFSLTTSDPEYASNRSEFLFDPRRLNVSATRARVKLIVIGSRGLLDAEAYEPRGQEGLEALKELIVDCHLVDWEG